VEGNARKNERGSLLGDGRVDDNIESPGAGGSRSRKNESYGKAETQRRAEHSANSREKKQVKTYGGRHRKTASGRGPE